MKTSEGRIKSLISLSGIIALVLLWALISLTDKSGFIIPSPLKVVKELFQLLITFDFWKNVFFTFGRVAFSFVISSMLGLIAGFLWGLKPLSYSFFKPVLTVIKSVPVVSLILIFVFWFGTDYIPVIAAVLMTFPVVAETVKTSVAEYPEKLLRMAKVYKLSSYRKLKYMYFPFIKNSFLNACQTVFSQSWKIVCAAEVLSLPKNALGTELFNSKVNVEMASLFALTIGIIILCGLTDFLFSILVKHLTNKSGTGNRSQDENN